LQWSKKKTGKLGTEAVAVNNVTIAPKKLQHSEPNSQSPILKSPHAFCLAAQSH